jgi:superfamily II DNA or RNA helicase
MPLMDSRQFQDDLIAATRQALKRHPAVILQSPTGSGKTVMSSIMVKGALAKGGRPWFVCHRDFLVEQTSLTFYGIGVDHGIIAPGRPFNPYKPCQVAAIDTLKNRLPRIPAGCFPTVIFVDEAQHSAAGGWAKVIEWALLVGAKVVGLSATPERLDGKPLNPPYAHLIPGPSVAWLMDQGYLSQYRAFAPSSPALGGVKTRGGDYAVEDIEEEMDKPTLVGDMVGHYKTHALGKRAIYFCVSLAHSKHVAAAFVAAGVPAVHLDGGTPTAERKAAALAMAEGRISVLTNVALFGEGYDLAAQAGRDVTVEVVGLARPTKSLALYMQQVGRALRKKSDAAIILDHAGNIEAHGLPDDERAWTLEGRKKGDQKAEVAVAVCKSCFATYRAVLRACPECGAVKPVAEIPAKALTVGDGELVEVDPAEMRRSRQKQESACRNVVELVQLGRARGLEEPESWARKTWSIMERKRDYGAQKRAEAHLRR